MWQIVNGKLELVQTSMVEAGRKETEDLEKWIKSNPSMPSSATSGKVLSHDSKTLAIVSH
ncbi:MAG TPA: hypothetical protein ENG66_09640 [Thermococcus sp.]|nr:hypothetical protein [Thermococcus sp.]